ncbi:MAG TPA: hypothetical protein VIF09_27955 [Polyangiaceae bacterium]|jgi:hypothetical protein
MAPPEQDAAPTEPEAPPGTVELASDELPPVREPAESRDDSSYPPVDLDTHFFDGSDRHSEHDLEHEEHDPRMVLKLTPEVAQRRADLQKYVKIAVAAAAALCLAAGVKVSLAHSQGDGSPRRASVVTAAVIAPVQTAAPQVAAPAPAPPAPVETEVSAAAPPAPPVDTAAPAAAAAPPATAAAAGQQPPAADAPPAQPDPVAAAKEKTTSRNALERGKNADAIEAGEKSVALDPTDGEAWLILGAAYQAKGDMKNARRSYKACIEQGKRGPRGECMAMPH